MQSHTHWGENCGRVALMDCLIGQYELLAKRASGCSHQEVFEAIMQADLYEFVINGREIIDICKITSQEICFLMKLLYITLSKGRMTGSAIEQACLHERASFFTWAA